MDDSSHRDGPRSGRSTREAERDTTRDELLAIRCQLGEPDAFDELIARWHGPLWQYVRRVTGDDSVAQDTIQDIWVGVLRGMASLRDGARLRAWLFGIARCTVMDRMREKYRKPRLVDHEDLDEHELQEADVPWPSQQVLDTLEEQLTRLPMLEREVLILFYLRELSVAEVAEVSGVPIGTVKSRLFRARTLLRAQLAAHGVER
jgi:RNA polymerase sigma factor (sigma-70 family)